VSESREQQETEHDANDEHAEQDASATYPQVVGSHTHVCLDAAPKLHGRGYERTSVVAQVSPLKPGHTDQMARAQFVGTSSVQLWLTG
jgi:hypothetical protein